MERTILILLALADLGEKNHQLHFNFLFRERCLHNVPYWQRSAKAITCKQMTIKSVDPPVRPSSTLPPFCPSVRLFVFRLSVSVSSSIHSSVCLSFSLFLNSFVCLSVYLSNILSVCLFVYPCLARPSSRLSVSLSAWLSFCLSVYLSFYLSVYAYIRRCLSASVRLNWQRSTEEI